MIRTFRSASRILALVCAPAFATFLEGCSGAEGDEDDAAAAAQTAAQAQEASEMAAKLLNQDPDTLDLVAGSFEVASANKDIGSWQVFTLRSSGNGSLAEPTSIERAFAVAPNAKYACYVDLNGPQACAGDSAEGIDADVFRSALSKDLLAFADSPPTAEPKSLGSSGSIRPQAAGTSAVTDVVMKLIAEAIRAGNLVTLTGLSVTAKEAPKKVGRAGAAKVIATVGKKARTYKVAAGTVRTNAAKIPKLTEGTRAWLESYAGKSNAVPALQGKVGYGEKGIAVLESRQSEGALVLGKASWGDQWTHRSLPFSGQIDHVVTTEVGSLSNGYVKQVQVLSSDMAMKLAESRSTNALQYGSLIVAGGSSGDAYTSALRIVREVWCSSPGSRDFPLLLEALRSGKVVNIKDGFDGLQKYLLNLVDEKTLTKTDFDKFIHQFINVK